MTTTDGIQYFFGYNKMPGSPNGKAKTELRHGRCRSSATTPNEPCYKASDFAASWCTQAWRWNLDYVVDPHSNAVIYYYTPETNRYART